MPHQFIERLIRRVDSIHPLDAEDHALLRALPLQVREIGAREHIVREGDRPAMCCILFEGMAGWYKMTGDGKRQILAIHIAGDIPDLHSLHQGAMDSSLLTLCPCTVGFVSHQAVLDACARRPNLASAFWRMTLADGSVFREWVANLGARQGAARLAHLLCELATRYGAVGLIGEEFSISLPLSQSELGDATGFSTVHVNRTLQELRRQRLIRFEKSTLHVLDWDGLQAAGDFDPNYLLLASPFVRKTRATTVGAIDQQPTSQ